MAAAGVVEGRQTLDAENHLPPYDPHVTDEPVTLPRARHDRHEVKGLGQARRREEAGQEHVGIGQVELVAVGVLHRSQREMPALLVVEDGAEDTRGVEGGQAQPVYGAVGTDERSRVQIPDDTVVLDRQIPHSSLLSQHRFPCLYLTVPCMRLAPHAPRALQQVSKLASPACQHAPALPPLVSTPPRCARRLLSVSTPPRCARRLLSISAKSSLSLPTSVESIAVSRGSSCTAQRGQSKRS